MGQCTFLDMVDHQYGASNHYLFLLSSMTIAGPSERSGLFSCESSH